jgi:hypothetical protein
LHAVQDGLSFGVAQADVELEHLGAFGGHHQSGVKEAGEGSGLDGRPDDAVEDGAALVRGKDARIAIGAHTAGVGAGIVIEDGLVILRGRQRNHIAAVAKDDEADFLSAQAVFDHEGWREGFQSGLCHGVVFRDYHAFAGGEAVRFDHHGVGEAVEGAAARGDIPSRGEGGGGDVPLPQKVLCENLAAFQPGGFRGGSEDGAAVRAKHIHHSRDQGRLRAHDGEIGIHRFGNRQVRGRRPVAGGQTLRDVRDAWIARSCEHPLDLGTLCDAPGERMLTPAAANDQHLHSRYNDNNARAV